MPPDFTDYHAKYFAHELTKRCSSQSVEKLAGTLVDAQVDLNPHQVAAALFAFKSPLSKGALLADEVGLGKTIEAGILLSQKWAERKRKILIIVPSSLRKQWNRELLEKFFLPSEILEARTFNQALKQGSSNPFAQDSIVICSYQFAANKADFLTKVPWDLVVIDEAHRLRNVYKKQNKTARILREALASTPKVLLTATPLQNSLMELYGLVSFIDEYTFGDQKSFRERYARLTTNDTFMELKKRLAPICQRTLRRQVLEYVKYTNRVPITQEFTPTPDEQVLYDMVSEYLRRDNLQALPPSQRTLMTLVMRKLPDASFVHPTYAGTYDDDNRLLTLNSNAVVHDDDGNMTSGAITATSGTIALAYNSRNQLTSAGGVSYTYDSEGHRRTMTDSNGTTRFTIDANANMSRLLVRHNPDGTKTFYVYGLGLLYEVDEADNTKTYHFDQVGSTIARTDDTGAVIGRAEYSPYGLVTMKTGDMDTPFLYNGKWGIYSDENGLLNMRARYYSPYLMRFLNADPIGFSGGQNWFAYANGDPISTLDPFGLWGWRNTLSMALDFVPVVSTVKAAVEVVAGYDIVAGEEVNRAVAAAGLAASFVPGGKAAVKGGSAITKQVIKHGDEVAEAAALAVRHGDSAPIRVTQFFDETKAFPVDGSRALHTTKGGMDRLDFIPQEGATWVIPKKADSIDDFTHFMTGRGNRSSYVEFDAYPSELVSPPLKPWQTFLPGSTELLGRNAVTGVRSGNIVDATIRQSGFYGGVPQLFNRLK